MYLLSRGSKTSSSVKNGDMALAAKHACEKQQAAPRGIISSASAVWRRNSNQ